MHLIPQRSVNEFFHEAVGEALDNQGVKATEPARFYLVNLLAEYATHTIGDGPLGIELAEAAWRTPEERASTLREVGDRSLYVSGFFAESLQRKLVDVDYYIQVGGTAYRQLASMHGAQRVRGIGGDVFRELAEQFAVFVEVLTEVSEATLHGGANVVQLWERWTRTGSPSAAKRLRAHGVFATRRGAAQ